MLDRCLSAELMPKLWRSLPSQAMLPLGGAEFYGAEAQQPAFPITRRRFERINVRVPAIMMQEETYHGIYIRDASRMGLGIYSPIQLLPMSEVRIWLPEEDPLILQVRRCVKQQRQCYEVGGEFTEGALTANVFRELFMATVG